MRNGKCTFCPRTDQYLPFMSPSSEADLLILKCQVWWDLVKFLASHCQRETKPNPQPTKKHGM